MTDKLDGLLERMQKLEKEIIQSCSGRSTSSYEVRQRKVQFTAEAKARHQKLAKRLLHSIVESRVLIILTTPIIWAVRYRRQVEQVRRSFGDLQRPETNPGLVVAPVV